MQSNITLYRRFDFTKNRTSSISRRIQRFIAILMEFSRLSSQKGVIMLITLRHLQFN